MMPFDWLSRVLEVTPLWSKMLSLEALIVILIETGIIVFSGVLYRLGRGKLDRLASGVTPAAAPRCAVIVPAKELSCHLERNLETLLGQQYPDFQVYFAVESEDDSAVPLIRSLCRRYGHAHLVIAGLTGSGCQKNHNMLAGVRGALEAEVLAFADDDIVPPRNWLATLIAPLADPGVTVTSGYRWIKSCDKGFAAQLHIFYNLLLYTHFSAIAQFSRSFVWGGSFALRRKDFDEMGVAGRWSESMSDDMSLPAVLAEHGKKSLLIPGFLIETDETLGSTTGALNWFTRQLMNLKGFYYRQWLLLLMPLSLGIARTYLISMLILGWYFSGGDSSFLACGGLTALVLIFGELLIAMSYNLLGPLEGRVRFVARIHLFRICFVISCFKTIWKMHLDWAGVRYFFNRHGLVTQIVR